jgi:formylglycine-generating enzyme required for sulfatase activity
LFRPRAQAVERKMKIAALPKSVETVRGKDEDKPAAPPAPKPDTRKAAPGYTDCEYCPQMIVLPAGDFVMGTSDRYEGPAHRVSFSQPFAISRFEITFAQWDFCVAAGRCSHRPKDEGWGHDERPVIHVSHQKTAQYFDWLSRISGKPYRLPSEAEWEYAARAGTHTARYWGEKIGSDHANCWQCGPAIKKTLPVGRFPANAFALHDMLGNVHEWVGDCFRASYKGAPADGSTRLDGNCKKRISRGGSWSTAYQAVTVSTRKSALATRGDKYTGFRAARSIAPNDRDEWRRLAASGDRVSQHHLAMLQLRDGNVAQAAVWLRRSAAQDWPPAQYELGRLDGIPAKEAGAWLEKAALAGHAKARLALADLLAPDDPVSAYMWLELAIALTPGEDIERAAQGRKTELAKSLSLPDIMKAQKRARKMIPAQQ